MTEVTCGDDLDAGDNTVFRFRMIQIEEDSRITQDNITSQSSGDSDNISEGKDNEVAETMEVRDDDDTSSENLNDEEDDSDERRCKICKANFTCPFALKLHSRKHTGERPYQCRTCGKSYFSKGNLKQHKLIHSGSKPYQCDVCSRKFRQKQALTQHKCLGRLDTRTCWERPGPNSLVHQPVQTYSDSKESNWGAAIEDVKSGKYSIVEASEAYNVNKQTIYYRVKQLGIKVIKHEKRGRKRKVGVDINHTVDPALTSTQKLIIHVEEKDAANIQVEEGSKILQDPLTSQYDGDSDNISEDKEDAETMEVTGDDETSDNSLDDEEENTDDLQCKVCGKRLSSKRDLTRHQLIHSGSKPYQCDVCSRKFRDRRTVTTHKCLGRLDLRNRWEPQDTMLYSTVTDHSMEAEGYTETSDNELYVTSKYGFLHYTCRVCREEFPSRRPYLKHMLDHNELQYIETSKHCPLCSYSYKSPSSYILNHIMTHAKIKPFRCHICSKQTSTERLLRGHGAAIHGDANFYIKVTDSGDQDASEANEDGIIFLQYYSETRDNNNRRTMMACKLCGVLLKMPGGIRKAHSYTHSMYDKLRFHLCKCHGVNLDTTSADGETDGKAVCNTASEEIENSVIKQLDEKISSLSASLQEISSALTSGGSVGIIRELCSTYQQLQEEMNTLQLRRENLFTENGVQDHANSENTHRESCIDSILTAANIKVEPPDSDTHGVQGAMDGGMLTEINIKVEPADSDAELDFTDIPPAETVFGEANIKVEPTDQDSDSQDEAVLVEEDSVETTESEDIEPETEIPHGTSSHVSTLLLADLY